MEEKREHLFREGGHKKKYTIKVSNFKLSNSNQKFIIDAFLRNPNSSSYKKLTSAVSNNYLHGYCHCFYGKLYRLTLNEELKNIIHGFNGASVNRPFYFNMQIRLNEQTQSSNIENENESHIHTLAEEVYEAFRLLKEEKNLPPLSAEQAAQKKIINEFARKIFKNELDQIQSFNIGNENESHIHPLEKKAYEAFQLLKK